MKIKNFMEQQIPLPKQDYMVNISCMTYNHEDYIEEALKGFVMQKTDFPFCALVIDDASTDGTAEIIRQYEQKYPEIIKGVYLTENHYSIKKSKIPYYRPWRERSKYIAICEGDDYWTDPLKLQKQVDFLEANSEYSVCTHTYKIYYQKSKKWGDISPTFVTKNLIYNLDYFITAKWVTQPLTALYRKDCFDINLYSKYKYSKDATLFYLLLKNGEKGICLFDTMGVYRLNEESSFYGASRTEKLASTLQTLIGIHTIENDKTSAKYLQNVITTYNYLGISFFRKHLRCFRKCLNIIRKHLGTWNSMKTLFNACNFLKRK